MLKRIERKERPDWHHFYCRDFDRMGSFFEYVAWNTNYDIEEFIRAFMTSRIRAEMEDYEPRYSSEFAGELLDDFINYRKRSGFPDIKEVENPTRDYRRYEMMWVGQFYSTLNYELSLTSKEIYEIMPLNIAREFFIVGHEMDFDAVVDRFLMDYNMYVEEQNKKEE